MKIFDFVCEAHPEKIVSVESACLKDITSDQKTCSTCKGLMERYYGGSSPSIAYRGPNWPKRDIRERVYRLRRADDLSKKQKKTWGNRMPKLNLDPEAQREARRQVMRSGATLGAKKV